jgi:DNA-3-methyladenine glycosylase II
MLSPVISQSGIVSIFTRLRLIKPQSMRVTRSKSRAAATASDLQESETKIDVKTNVTRAKKRKATAQSNVGPDTKKTRTTAKTKTSVTVASPTKPLASGAALDTTEALVPAVLTFSFEDAKKHLIEVDDRFEDIFNRMHCKPYEHLEQLDPFR